MHLNMHQDSSPNEIQVQVDALRKKLLDLSLRNRMLNYRLSRRIGIEFSGEESRHLFSILVVEGKKMTFVGKPERRKDDIQVQSWLYDDEVALEALRQEAEDELDAYLKNPSWLVDVLDSKLNTNEPESILQTKLRTIAREADLAREELGIHTLFLTLGVLEWSDQGEKRYKAPLLFVPVNLECQANDTIKLVYEGSDVGDNLPLRAKLEEFSLRLPEYDEDKSVETYFASVEEAVRRFSDWKVLPDEVYLGFFNYEKYVMYVDLGGQYWPEGRKPWQHPELIALLGGGYDHVNSPVTDQTQLDRVRTVWDSHEVFDADSSQTLAMTRVAEGHSIVIEGPPGTGKSQTITNIIAEAVARGKTVLFVAAKRAAVDVVKRNLDRADLGDMCLDLYDKLTNRRAFYAEIKRTVQSSVNERAEEEKLENLQSLRERLNAHCESVNEPLPDFGASPFQAMSILASLPDETPEDREGRIPFDKLRFLTCGDVRRLVPLVEALQSRLKACGVPIEHPFWGAGIDQVDPAVRLDLMQELLTAQSKLASAAENFVEAAKGLKVDLKPTAANAILLQKCLDQALQAPPHDGVAVRKQTWIDHENTVLFTVGMLRTSQTLRQRWDLHVQDDIWSADLSFVEDTYVDLANKWYRHLSGRFWKARRQLGAFLKPGVELDALRQLELVRDVVKAQAAERTIDAEDATMRRLVGVQWAGRKTDPGVVEGLMAWVTGLGEMVESGKLPSGLLDLLEGGGAYEHLVGPVAGARSSAESAVDAFRKVAAMLVFPVEDFDTIPFDELAARVSLWLENLSKLSDYISFKSARRQVEEAGLSAIVEVADRWPLAAERLRDTFVRSYYLGVVRHAMDVRPTLKTFERESHEAALRDFWRLDDFLLTYNRARVRLAHRKQIPTFDRKSGNLQQLKIQCELQRRHRPIRWAMERAGEAIQKIKPVFMMSPLSVAIYLPPEMPPFDLVIFDEASQIRPEDALCSIIRGRQIVVVGDTRQMPPTSFFDRLLEDDETDDDASESLVGVEARKLESVLSLMSAVVGGGVRRPDLRWHYRSLHPTLIQPSNEMFYDNRLVVFPSPSHTVDGKRAGVVFHHLPHTVYEPGDRKRINRGEAEAIADRVLDHVLHHPEESLLVAAMNKAQADLIYDEVLKYENRYPDAFRHFQQRHPHEPLDVKNLENVQGDERDVVFISITYGRDANGVLRHNFGPLLKEGGERRLNVLITRARQRCEVFSNITAEDIRLDQPRAGVESLKRYLKFAKDGVVDVPTATGLPEESPFEEEVTAALRGRGYEVHTQVGTNGYRIDIGVVDPDQPGRYLLGVECDGATYHSARSARDRDKLRQRVLESRGWRLHRIWSHDWWQDRDAEVARLCEAIEKARCDRRATLPETHDDLPLPAEEQTATPSSVTEPISRDYVEATTRSATSGDELLSFGIEVVHVEEPISRELLLVRLRDAWGAKRAGSNLRPWLESIADRVGQQVRVAGEAYYLNEDRLRVPRDWSRRPQSERKFEYVPRVEFQAAVLSVVRRSFGIRVDDAVKEAYSVLGFRRVSELARAKGREAVDDLVRSGTIAVHNGEELRLPAR